MEKLNLEENNLQEVVETILLKTEFSKIILLKGNLGTGKTTLAKLLIRQLGIHETITSPTFNIVSEYKLSNGKMIYHFDLYRIKSIEELYEIGFEEYIDSGQLCIIEWPEIAEPLLPLPVIEVSISLSGQGRDYRIATLKQ